MVLVRFREEWQAIRDLSNELPNVELARSATRALCAVRQNIPFAFDVASTFSPGTTPWPGSYQITRRFWDSQCAEQPIPETSRDGAGLLGGQCPGVLYTVTGIITRTNVLPPNNPDAEFAVANCLGPLRDVWITTRAGGNGRQFVLNVIDSTGFKREGILGSDQITNPVIVNPRFRITPVDNCGIGIVPPPLPVLPPPNTFNIPITIGGEQRTVTVNLPEFDTSNWPEFTFSPTLEIEGALFEFDFGGVNITYEGGSSTPPPRVAPEIEQEIDTVNNTVNNVNNTVNEIVNEIENVTNTVNNIQTTINNELIADLAEILAAIKCCCCEDNVTYETETIATNSEGGVFNVPDDAIAIIISGSDFDLNDIRTQSGSGTAPTVFYWGWASVNYGGTTGGERVPLQFENQSLPVGEGATSVLVNPTYNSRCSVSVVLKRKNCNEHG